MLIEIDAVPGRTYSGVLRLENMSPSTQRVKLYLEDWDKLPDGTDVALEPGAIERSCRSWISLSSTHYDIPGEDRGAVKYSLRVPDGASGAYWTSIMAEAAGNPDTPDRAARNTSFAIETRFRYSVRVLVNVMSGSRTRGAVSDMSITENGDSLTAAVTLKNEGNTILKPGGYVEVRNTGGETVARGEFYGRNYVIPGRERNISTSLTRPLSAGDYIALAVLDIGTHSLLAGETRFSVD